MLANCENREAQISENNSNASILLENIKIYPNPNNGIFILQSNDKLDAEIMVYDILGKIIFQKHTSISDSQNIDINLKDKDKGLYFIKVIGTGSLLYSSKFIIN